MTEATELHDDEDAPEVDEVLNAPERIWLNVGDLDGPIDLQCADLQGITWCDIQQGRDDVEYVRADLVATMKDSK